MESAGMGVRSLSTKGRRSAILEQTKAEARAFFLDSKLNLLMAALPFAFVSRFAGWGDGATFTLSCLALIPLAERLGFVTEQLAMYTNDTLGGLLNATFGNATELIISAFALAQAAKHRRDPDGEVAADAYLRVVQLSLLGSVASNLLLVMGTAFIAGGIRNKEQLFNQTAINVNCGMLVLATFAILLPSLLDATTPVEIRDRRKELSLSRFEAICMVLCYCIYLYFQLRSHRHLFEEESSPPAGATAPGPAPRLSGNGMAPPLGLSVSGLRGSDLDLEAAGMEPNGVGGALARGSLVDANRGRVTLEMTERMRTSSGRSASAKVEAVRGTAGERQPLVLAADGGPGMLSTPGGHSDDGGGGHGGGSDGDEEEELVLSKVGCFMWLTGVTIFISFLSEFVTDAIRGASSSLNMPLPFLTAVLLPLVGNAAEHASAVMFAYKNRIEIALGVAVGSSTQVSMMVVPLCVLLAWTMGLPLDLDFNAFESFVLFGSVLLAVLVVQDGHANYIKGVLLVLTFVFISAGFWCHKDINLEGEDRVKH